MKIIWDEPKRLANLTKKRMNFADLNESCFDQAFVLPALGNRHRGIGVNIRGVICVVFAYYGREAISVISMRPASSNERKAYEENRR